MRAAQLSPPGASTQWRDIRVDLSTHSLGALALPDLILASKIDAIPVDYSPKWLELRLAAGGAAPGAATGGGGGG